MTIDSWTADGPSHPDRGQLRGFLFKWAGTSSINDLPAESRKSSKVWLNSPRSPSFPIDTYPLAPPFLARQAHPPPNVNRRRRLVRMRNEETLAFPDAAFVPVTGISHNLFSNSNISDIASEATPTKISSSRWGWNYSVSSNAHRVPESLSASSTTVALICLLHVVFAWQWYRRRLLPKYSLVSYRILIQKKQFHRAWVAFLSHPGPGPPDQEATAIFRRPSGGNHSTEPPLPLHSAQPPSTHGHHSHSGRQMWLSTIQGTPLASIRPFLESCCSSPPLQVILDVCHHRGALLMLYNAHVLWSCRALEMHHRQHGQDPWHYSRVLAMLSLLSLSLELGMCHFLLLKWRLHPLGFGSEPTPSALQALQQLRHPVIHRTMGTCTGLSVALIVLFRRTFPHVSLQLLPFLSNPFFLSDPSVSSWLCVFLLVFLCRKIHSVSGVLGGGGAGFLWAWAGLDFMGEAYWSMGILVPAVLMALVSLKAQWQHSGSTTAAAWIPCISHVSWDENGEIWDADETDSTSRERTLLPLGHGNNATVDAQELYDEDAADDHSDDNDNDMGSDGEVDWNDLEDDSQRAFPIADDEEIYGRIPWGVTTSMGEDEDENNSARTSGNDNVIPQYRWDLGTNDSISTRQNRQRSPTPGWTSDRGVDLGDRTATPSLISPSNIRSRRVLHEL